VQQGGPLIAVTHHECRWERMLKNFTKHLVLIHYPIKIGLQKYETQTTHLNDWAIQIDPHG
jgi:hypothetical protein